MNLRISPREGSMPHARIHSAPDWRARAVAMSPIALAAASAFCNVSAYAEDAAAEPLRQQSRSASAPLGRQQANSAPAGEFDIEALRTRGIDPALAAYFSRAPRFTPGRQRVSLFVNDVRRGTAAAMFDDQGNLCFDRTLLDQAALVIPDALTHEPRKTPGGKESGKSEEKEAEGEKGELGRHDCCLL
jgi:outer membrane usher protein FimD/PapC